VLESGTPKKFENSLVDVKSVFKGAGILESGSQKYPPMAAGSKQTWVNLRHRTVPLIANSAKINYLQTLVGMETAMFQPSS
jgi:hypothetical protein